MKKMICTVLMLLLILFAAGCAQAAPQQESVSASPPAVLAEEEAPRVQEAARDPSEAVRQTFSSGQDGIDVDLTVLSSTMVYSEVFAMASEPEQYDGKTVRMRGIFMTQEYEGDRLYACVVQDATACCAQGLVFRPVGTLSYPDDFPAPGEEITVTGVFSVSRQEQAGEVYLSVRLEDSVLG